MYPSPLATAGNPTITIFESGQVNVSESVGLIVKLDPASAITATLVLLNKKYSCTRTITSLASWSHYVIAGSPSSGLDIYENAVKGVSSCVVSSSTNPQVLVKKIRFGKGIASGSSLNLHDIKAWGFKLSASEVSDEYNPGKFFWIGLYTYYTIRTWLLGVLEIVLRYIRNPHRRIYIFRRQTVKGSNLLPLKSIY